MKLPPRRRVLLSGLLPALVVAALALYHPPFLRNLENSNYDRLLRQTPARAPGGRVVIVDVDDPSLSAIGQWPWRRDVIGRLVSAIRDRGAAVVALDIVFAEPDRYEGGGHSPDQTLADTLAQGRVVLGYALTFDGASSQAGSCVQHPLGLAIIRQGDDRLEDPFFRASGVICSLPLLAQAAGASGFFNATPDADGRLRRAPLLASFADRVYPGLALAAVLHAQPPRDMSVRVLNVNASALSLDRQTVPLDAKSNALLRYRGPKRTFPYVSAGDVLSGKTAADAFKDKIVFVGTTALGTREVVATPIDTLFAGVEVQATIADNLLQDDFIHRPEYSVLVETQLVVGLGIIVALLVGRLGIWWGGLGVAACLGAVWGGAILLLWRSGMFLSPLYPMLGLVASFATMAIEQLTVERSRADQAGHDKVTTQRLMVQALLSLTEVRHAETGRHSRRTQEYARLLAQQLARHPDYRSYLTPERIDLLASLAPLHDIGKVGIPDQLLNKPGALTADEVLEMRKHPMHGRDVILHAEQDVGKRDDAILALAKDIVYTHHEKWDGTGYPQGLRGTSIPIAGRLMALVDVYDAVTSRRVYREPMSHEDAVMFIASCRGTHFDPCVVDAFLKVSPDVKRLSADREAGVH